ncbi:MAG: hypothetical protein WCX77_02980 [Candidatus Paceibacterota bacterium]|jgi:hypothetical protein
MKKFIYYLPRVLAILIVAFFAMFILEGFSPEFSWQSSLMHSLLAFVALLIAITAWKWPGIGGWIFVIFGAGYLAKVFNSNWQTGLIVGGIPLLAGILFLVEWLGKRKASIKGKQNNNKV